jgi:hypothetical protein
MATLIATQLLSRFLASEASSLTCISVCSCIERFSSAQIMGRLERLEWANRPVKGPAD